MNSTNGTIAGLLVLVVLSCTQQAFASSSQDTEIARGKYLVKVIGCSDCHTPGGFTPQPDVKRYMAGSDADFLIPGAGVFTSSNLTPDKTTGLGMWTVAQIATAITTGVTPTGRILSPAMPWADFSNLTKSDAEDIAIYLKSIPAVKRKIPDPRAERPCIAKALECVVQREQAPR